jgi:hypothetical protein
MSRFSQEKIIAVLKQWEAGVKPAELMRKHGVSEADCTTGNPGTVDWTSRSCGG